MPVLVLDCTPGVAAVDGLSLGGMVLEDAGGFTELGATVDATAEDTGSFARVN